MAELTFDEMIDIIHQAEKRKVESIDRANNRFNALKEDMFMVFDLIKECERCGIYTQTCSFSSKDDGTGIKICNIEYPNRLHTKICFIYKDEKSYMWYDTDNRIIINDPDDKYSAIDGKNIEDVGPTPALINAFCDSFLRCKKEVLMFIKELATNTFDD